MKISHFVWSFLLGVMILSTYFTSSIAQTQDTAVAQVQDTTSAQVQDTTTAQVQDTTKLGDGFDGNWANPVHLIKLYDDEGDLVTPDEQPLMPFSTKQTCQECHDYNTISKGWHFNYLDPSVPAGRPGEPWVLVNRKSSTQIPLSYRPWGGTFNPDSIGLSRWQFIQDFGRQLPGGGVGEHINPENPDIYMRWLISGDLQINCLACHDAAPDHDESEYALQTIRQNFRWAAAATAGFARVEGSAADVPNDYDIYRGTVPDNPNVIPPTVHYDKTRWDYNNQVFIDIQHSIPSNNCYFCHSSMNLEKGKFNRWKMDQDVHLTSGMTCVDCHREGLDHNTIRGYEGEPGRENDPYAESLTCEGCHLGNDASKTPHNGRLGAPKPKHAGIPAVHFEKLTCTACHSGPRPEEMTQGVKTARIHALGLKGTNKSPDVLPHVQYPVYVKGEDGKIAPHKLFWPAYWAFMQGDSIQPILPDIVMPIATEVLVSDTVKFTDWPPMTKEQVGQILTRLADQSAPGKTPVYIGGGKLYQLDASGAVLEQNSPAAQPYSWAFAHNVRPANQALGVRGCNDCHSVNAPFSFGRVKVDAAVMSDRGATVSMASFQGLGTVYPRVFAISFLFRPWLKVLTLGATIIIAAVLLLYAFKGFAHIIKVAGTENS